VKAYIKRNKHDAADAEAICEFCMAFTRFLASSVTAKIAARMPSRRTATSRRLP
jgi:transposase